VRDLLPYGGPAALACVAWTGFRNGDYAIIGARLGTAQAGFYYRGYQLAVEYQKKISAVMAHMAFPVLARAEGPEAMFALRRRMVQLLTVVLFPLLALLTILAPTVVPWLFGPEWEPAVVPTQILAAGGAATLTIDAVGSALQAAGRTSTMLGFGIAHFIIYAAVVIVVSPHGIAAVAGGAAVVHTAFLVVAYHLMLRGHGQGALRVLWDDLAAALVSCGGLVAVAWPVLLLLERTGAGALITIGACTLAGAAAYLVVLRGAFPTAAGDLGTALRRILPERIVSAGSRIAGRAFGPALPESRRARA
jgi:lipopolysaccharide exporter